MPTCEPATILVVEDDASMSEAIARMLRVGGYRAVLFDSAEAALDSDQTALADCLILDIQLPGMSGIELLRFLVMGGQDTPAILITAHDEPRIRIEAGKAGAKSYLTKPFAGRVLLDAVDACMEPVDTAADKCFPPSLFRTNTEESC